MELRILKANHPSNNVNRAKKYTSSNPTNSYLILEEMPLSLGLKNPSQLTYKSGLHFMALSKSEFRLATNGEIGTKKSKYEGGKRLGQSLEAICTSKHLQVTSKSTLEVTK